MPYAPSIERDDEVVLYEHWFISYMQQRERASYFVAWLLAQRRGVASTNGPLLSIAAPTLEAALATGATDLEMDLATGRREYCRAGQDL